MKKVKPLFIERIKELMNDEEDLKKYFEYLEFPAKKSIRCNKIKISPEKLKKILEKKGWKIKQPFKNYPETMIIESNLGPGELGKTLEHILGYYYIQEISSMLPIFSLSPKENEKILDLCSSPGSKTTQIASEMQNKGTIIANDISLGRIKILATNLERCGVRNCVLTKSNGVFLCKKFLKEKIFFDKILVDAPCSGEGTLRSSYLNYKIWSLNLIKRLSSIQKSLLSASFEILKINGEMIYSTCTHAPEENEEIVDFLINKFKEKVKIEKVILPLKSRKGLTEWGGKKYNKEVEKSTRIYPQDNNTEGFFIAKIKKIK